MRASIQTFCQVVTSIYDGFFGTASLLDVRDRYKGGGIFFKGIVEVLFVAIIIGAHAAAEYDNLWLYDGDKVNKAKGYIVADVFPGDFISNV